MEEILSFIFIIVVFILNATLDNKKNNREDETNWDLIEPTNFFSYSNFYGEKLEEKESPEIFKKKIDKIYDLVVKQKCDDIKFIAKASGCSYHECVFKIDYLKHKKMISDEYFLDLITGFIKKCSTEDKALLDKYRPFLKYQKLQIPEITVRLPHVTSETLNEEMEKVKKDVKYLIEKDLIQGVIYNEVDDNLIYYDANKTKNNLITKKCPNCGAKVELNTGGKARCEYCDSIITSSEPRIISKIEK